MRSLSLSGADFAGRELEPWVEDLRDKLAEHDTTCGLEHQVKIDQFQAFISRLSMAEASSPGSASSHRKASREDALISKYCRAVLRESRIRRTAQKKVSFRCGRMPFSCGTARIREFASLGRVKFHTPPL